MLQIFKPTMGIYYLNQSPEKKMCWAENMDYKRINEYWKLLSVKLKIKCRTNFLFRLVGKHYQPGLVSFRINQP